LKDTPYDGVFRPLLGEQITLPTALARKNNVTPKLSLLSANVCAARPSPGPGISY